MTEWTNDWRNAYKREKEAWRENLTAPASSPNTHPHLPPNPHLWLSASDTGVVAPGGGVASMELRRAWRDLRSALRLRSILGASEDDAVALFLLPPLPLPRVGAASSLPILSGVTDFSSSASGSLDFSSTTTFLGESWTEHAGFTARASGHFPSKISVFQGSWYLRNSIFKKMGASFSEERTRDFVKPEDIVTTLSACYCWTAHYLKHTHTCTRARARRHTHTHTHTFTHTYTHAYFGWPSFPNSKTVPPLNQDLRLSGLDFFI